jgi:hypothetical protein
MTGLVAMGRMKEDCLWRSQRGMERGPKSRHWMLAVGQEVRTPQRMLWNRKWSMALAELSTVRILHLKIELLTAAGGLVKSASRGMSFLCYPL